MSNREENNSNFVRWCTSKSMQPTHRAAQAWQAACELKDKEIESLRHERNVLQKICAERSDELDALKSQKPIGYWRHTFAGKLCINKSLQCNIDGNSPELPDSTPLYSRPVPAILEGYVLVPIELSEIQSYRITEAIHGPLLCGPSMITQTKRYYKSIIAVAQEKSR